MQLNFSDHVRNLQKMRVNKYVKSPNTVKEIIAAYAQENVMREYGMTKHNERRAFYKHAHEDENSAFVIFASDTIIDLIKENIEVKNRRYLMDATFKVVPYNKSNFKQFLVIHVEYLNKVSVISLSSSG